MRRHLICLFLLLAFGRIAQAQSGGASGKEQGAGKEKPGASGKEQGAGRKTQAGFIGPAPQAGATRKGQGTSKQAGTSKEIKENKVADRASGARPGEDSIAQKPQRLNRRQRRDAMDSLRRVADDPHNKAPGEEDSVRHTSRIHDIFNMAVQSISTNPYDTIDQARELFFKTEDAYKRYKNAYIRRIVIKQLRFGKQLSDTSTYIENLGSRIYNGLHYQSRSWVIRNNVFLKEKEKVDPFKIADNERFLRTLEFIEDARILIAKVPNHPDSVDIIVVTKDLFSITGDLGSLSDSRVDGKLGEFNFLGMGQTVRFSGLWDRSRNPTSGYELLYAKNNIGGSFINGAVGYSQINSGISLGIEDEEATFIRLERPLISPNTHLAGGLEVSQNQSLNTYAKVDSFYYNYNYDSYDVWAGYNINVQDAARDRTFFALRYYRQKFYNIPMQIGKAYDPIYNDKLAILGSVTFFKQDFYKTNYIYGFGTTEDLPYGYQFTATAGFYQQKDLNRPYVGFDINRYIASPVGEFYQFFLKSGAFVHRQGVQDASVLAGLSVFGRLMRIRETKFRLYALGSYSQQFNRITTEALRINNQLGIRNFSPDSVRGNSRVNGYLEGFLFLRNPQILGFKFSPFTFVNAAYIKADSSKFFYGDFFSSVGGGFRARNEHLIFKTIELRLIYFLQTAYNIKSFKAEFTTNINFRYRSNYVAAPDIISLNTDDYLY